MLGSQHFEVFSLCQVNRLENILSIFASFDCFVVCILLVIRFRNLGISVSGKLNMVLAMLCDELSA